MNADTTEARGKTDDKVEGPRSKVEGTTKTETNDMLLAKNAKNAEDGGEQRNDERHGNG